MAVLTGRSGQFYVDGVRVARCTGWNLDESRPMLESTTVDSWDRTFVPGRIEGEGSAKLLYDPSDSAAVAFFDSIFESPNTASEVPVTAILNDATGLGYPMAVHVSSVSHAVAKGQAQMRDVAFRLSDVGLELEILGSNRVAIGSTQRYTGNVYGLSGSWTYLWTIAGATISNPNSQTTDIAFSSIGSYTLILTATLGATVLTETLDIEVIDIPLMWISRPTSPMTSDSFQLYGTTMFDRENQHVYHASMSYPDISVAPRSVTLSKLDYAGVRLQTARITGNVSDYVTAIHRLNDGSVFLLVARSFYQYWMRVSADFSSIIYQTGRIDNTYIHQTVYDPATNRIFCATSTRAPSAGGGGSQPFIGYIDGATGNLTRLLLSMSPVIAITRASVIKLQSGKILFTLCASTHTVFVECNDDLRVGGLFNAIRIVEHVHSTTISPLGQSVETDNYIAVVSAGSSQNPEISLYSKADYSHIKTRRTNLGGGEGLGLYYKSGVLNIAFAGAPGWRIAQVDEEAETLISFDQVFSTATEAGPPWPNNAPGVGYGTLNATFLSSNAFDPDLGVMATHLTQNVTSLSQREMVAFFRVNYAASQKLQYNNNPNLWMTMNPASGALGGSVLTPPSNTFNRTYGFTQVSPTITSPGVSMANESFISFQTYVVA